MSSPPLKTMIWTAYRDPADESNKPYRIRCDYIRGDGQHIKVISYHHSYDNSDVDGLWRAVDSLKFYMNSQLNKRGWI